MPKPPGLSDRDDLSSLRARVRELEQEVARRQREAVAMAEAARLAGESPGVEALAEHVARSILRLFGAASACICRLEADGALQALAWTGRSSAPVFERGQVSPVGMAMGARAVALGRAVWTPDVLTDPDIQLTPEVRRLGEATADRAVLAVRLKTRGTVIGAVIIAYPLGHVFREDEVRLVEAFADQVALALENARLLAEARGRLAESETLLSVAGVLSQPVPIAEAMRRVAREVARSFAADTTGVYFLDAARQTFRPVAGYRVPTHLRSAFVETPFPVEFFAEALAERRPIWTSDCLADRRFDFPFLTVVRPGAVLLAPTLVRGEMVGAIVLVWWAPGRAFGPSEIRLVEGVASQVALAVENAERARQTTEKLDEMERLLSVSRALSSTIELGPLLRTLLQHLTRAVGADSAGVWLADPATGVLEPFAGYHVPHAVVERLRGFRIDPGRSSLYADAIARRAVVTSKDAPRDAGLPPGLVALAPHRAQLFAPVVANDRPVGAIIVVWWEREPTCGDRELALVDTMATHAGMRSNAPACSRTIGGSWRNCPRCTSSHVRSPVSWTRLSSSRPSTARSHGCWTSATWPFFSTTLPAVSWRLPSGNGTARGSRTSRGVAPSASASRPPS